MAKGKGQVKRLGAVAFVLIAVASGASLDAQYRNGQARPPAAATRPGPPRSAAGEAPFRNGATFRPRPISPSVGIPLWPFRYPVFPLVWGWGTMPFYFDGVGTPAALEDGPTGGVQLEVTPWRASVFVDGAYTGKVDDFKGYYQHLDVVAGPHQIVIIEPGYEALVLDVVVVPGRTTTLRGTLSAAPR